MGGLEVVRLTELEMHLVLGREVAGVGGLDIVRFTEFEVVVREVLRAATSGGESPWFTEDDVVVKDVLRAATGGPVSPVSSTSIFIGFQVHPSRFC